MVLVTSEKQIQRNLATLEAARRSPRTSAQYEAYARLVHRGRCFIPYDSDGTLHFAPSRFVGYVANSLSKHAASEERDGRKTNVAISKILGLALVDDPAVDDKFLSFCQSIGKTLHLNVPKHQRTFWLYGDATRVSEERQVQEIEADETLSPTTKKALIDARIGQGTFRRRVQKHWRDKCAITGCEITRLLRASHIRPWKYSDNAQRLDPFNGLFLSPNLDALFDGGLITFDQVGRLVCSPRLTDRDTAVLVPAGPLRLKLKSQHEIYLAYHREYVFRGEA